MCAGTAHGERDRATAVLNRTREGPRSADAAEGQDIGGRDTVGYRARSRKDSRSEGKAVKIEFCIDHKEPVGRTESITAPHLQGAAGYGRAPGVAVRSGECLRPGTGLHQRDRSASVLDRSREGARTVAITHGEGAVGGHAIGHRARAGEGALCHREAVEVEDRGHGYRIGRRAERTGVAHLQGSGGHGGASGVAVGAAQDHGAGSGGVRRREDSRAGDGSRIGQDDSGRVKGRGSRGEGHGIGHRLTATRGLQGTTPGHREGRCAECIGRADPEQAIVHGNPPSQSVASGERGRGVVGDDQAAGKHEIVAGGKSSPAVYGKIRGCQGTPRERHDGSDGIRGRHRDRGDPSVVHGDGSSVREDRIVRGREGDIARSGREIRTRGIPRVIGCTGPDVVQGASGNREQERGGVAREGVGRRICRDALPQGEGPDPGEARIIEGDGVGGCPVETCPREERCGVGDTREKIKQVPGPREGDGSKGGDRIGQG